MARRGALTALQAVLAGVSGGAQGLVQQQEMERKRQQEQADRDRQSLMDTLSLFEKGAFEAGPIATRAPMPRPQSLAAAGEAIPAKPGMGAIPPAGVSPEARQQAEAGLSRYETGGPGAMTFEVGGRRLALPSAATRRAEAAQDALSAAMQEAEATGAVQAKLARQARDEANRSAYEELRAIGEERGEYQPTRSYAGKLASYYRIRETEAGRAMTPYQLEQLALERRRVALAEGRAEESASNLPVAAKNNLARFDSGVLMAQNIGQLIQQNPEAMGGVKNFLPAQVTNRIDPAGVEVRAAVEALSGEIRNLRFGGQLTGGELSQAMTMLPDRQDEAEAALGKLRRLNQFLEQKRQGIFSAFGSSYTPMGTSAPAGAPVSGRGAGATARPSLPNNPDSF
jgi:hypothetical protein